LSGGSESIVAVKVQPTFVWLFDFLKSILNEKTTNKVILLENIGDLMHAIRVDEEFFPIEYGGKMDMQTIIKELKDLIEENREINITGAVETVINLDLYPTCVKELSLKSLKKSIEEIIEGKLDSQFRDFEEVRGSFKKLEID
jgi:hypothetical protein